MKKSVLLSLVLFGSLAHAQQRIEWKTPNFLDSIVNDPANDKVVIIDVYTDWCGWCKKMDATTFRNPEIVKLIQDHFVAVKMNGEDRNTIRFAGQEFKYVAHGRSGYNELPAALMQGNISYPTLVFLDEKANMIQPISGFHSAERLKPILIYIGQRKFEEMTWQDFVASYQ